MPGTECREKKKKKNRRSSGERKEERKKRERESLDEVNELHGKYLGHTYLGGEGGERGLPRGMWRAYMRGASRLARKGCGKTVRGRMKTERAGRLLVMAA